MSCKHACGSSGGPAWHAGDLTKFHMLYEGSFEEWSAHWEGACRVRTNNKLNRRRQSWFLEHDQTTIKEICDSISPYLSPYLLSRIPAARLACVDSLYTALKTASQPFRLMDLPADIRVCIYNYVDLDLDIDLWPSGTLGIPPLLASCRQVRREALPLASIHLSLESEHLDIFDNKDAPTADSDVNPLLYHDVISFREFRERLHSWAMHEGREFANGIRRLNVDYSQTCDACDLAFFEIELLVIPGQGVVRGCCQGRICMRSGPPSECCEDEGFMTDDKLRDIDGALAEFSLREMPGEVLVRLIVDALPYWTFLKCDRW